MRYVLLLLSLLLADQAFAAIAYDSANGTTKASGGGTTITISFTATGTSGAGNGLMLVGCILSTGGATTISSIKWNGTDLTQLQTVAYGATIRVDLWYLKLPETGTHNVVATTNNDVNSACSVVTYTGVAQGTTFGTDVSASGADSAPSVTVTTVAGEMVVDISGLANNVGCGTVPSPGANQTQRDTYRCLTGGLSMSMSQQNGVDGGVMSWSQVGSNVWTDIAVPLKPALTVRPVSPLLFN